MSPTTIYGLWWVSLVLLLVVTGVVAWLLARVLHTAKNIQGVVADIWTTGKMVANNTIHIPLLVETNRYAGRILATAQQIAAGAGAIEQHAAGCPGCPECVLESPRGAAAPGLIDKVKKALGQ